ncbi:uncharacterized protein LOC110841235 [Zootermopsis nevadensis]|uniref:uncharacterized protein LOC110841235 n=1 Tax=Zootermopsis nevadensis TaxID=136037 RepID=UPI000B8EBA46|nr:uncharacterized protein LOC110841235 [Zootermopsis nevadensis]
MAAGALTGLNNLLILARKLRHPLLFLRARRDLGLEPAIPKCSWDPLGQAGRPKGFDRRRICIPISSGLRFLAEILNITQVCVMKRGLRGVALAPPTTFKTATEATA